MEIKKTNELETEGIGKLIVKYSTPAIIAMVINAIYNVVDKIFIGNVPGLANIGLAALAVAFPVINLLIAMTLIFAAGASILFSINLGEKNYDEAGKVLGNSVFLLCIGGLVTSVLGLIFITPISVMFGADKNILASTEVYISIILIGSVFQYLSFGLCNFIRADGYPLVSMICILIGAITNMFFDYLFINVLKMGIAGAGMATVFAQMIASAFALYHFLSKRCTVKLKIENMKLNLKRFKQIVIFGIPTSSVQVASSIIGLILNKSLMIYGTLISVSAMGIVYSIQAVLVLPLIGLVQGVQPIISYNYGAGNRDRVLKALKIAVIFGTIFSISSYLITRIFPEELISMFTKKENIELINTTCNAMKLWMLCMPFLGLQLIGTNFFQATGNPKISTFLALSRQVVFIIPTMLILPKFIGYNGILLSAAVGDISDTILVSIFLFYRLRKFEIKKL